MNANIIASRVCFSQGTDDKGTFGYVASSDNTGGYFFHHRLSLQATLATLERDEIDGDGGMSLETAQRLLRSAWAKKRS